MDEGGQDGRLPRLARLVGDVGGGVVLDLLVPGSSVEDDLDARERTGHTSTQVPVLLLWVAVENFRGAQLHSTVYHWN